MAFGFYTIGKAFSDKGQTVFGEDYPQMIASTAHVRSRISSLFWVILVFAFIDFLVLEFQMTWEERSAGP